MSEDTTIEVPASDVRAWARNKGIEVGTRGHLPTDVIERFNRTHRKKKFVNRNPWLGG